MDGTLAQDGRAWTTAIPPSGPAIGGEGLELIEFLASKNRWTNNLPGKQLLAHN